MLQGNRRSRAIVLEEQAQHPQRGVSTTTGVDLLMLNHDVFVSHDEGTRGCPQIGSLWKIPNFTRLTCTSLPLLMAYQDAILSAIAVAILQFVRSSTKPPAAIGSV
jgi:hypothetical protein